MQSRIDCNSNLAKKKQTKKKAQRLHSHDSVAFSNVNALKTITETYGFSYSQITNMKLRTEQPNPILTDKLLSCVQPYSDARTITHISYSALYLVRISQSI